MALRKASAYSKKKTRPYTRKSNVRSKSYIKTIPQNKIVKYHMGDINAFKQGKFPFFFRLVSLEKVQIRDNAIEASRQLIHKILQKELIEQYFFLIKIHPHHFLRENKMLTGAGSDRMQTGMQLSFGKTIGRAALVPRGKEIFIVAVGTEKAAKIARKALSIAKSKLPCKVKILSEKKK